MRLAKVVPSVLGRRKGNNRKQGVRASWETGNVIPRIYSSRLPRRRASEPSPSTFFSSHRWSHCMYQRIWQSALVPVPITPPFEALMCSLSLESVCVGTRLQPFPPIIMQHSLLLTSMFHPQEHAKLPVFLFSLAPCLISLVPFSVRSNLCIAICLYSTHYLLKSIFRPRVQAKHHCPRLTHPGTWYYSKSILQVPLPGHET